MPQRPNQLTSGSAASMPHTHMPRAPPSSNTIQICRVGREQEATHLCGFQACQHTI